MMEMWLIIGLVSLLIGCGWVSYWLWQRQRARYAQQLNYQLDQYHQLLALQTEKYKWQYDSLTGLLTEHAFFSELEKAHTGTNHHWALIIIDLDDYHALSGGLNDDTQEQIVKFATENILNAVRKIDVLAHASQDVFWLWLRHVNQTESVGLIAQRILNSFSNEPIVLGDYAVHLSLSMGIALPDSNDISVQKMKNHAFYALTIAKQSGKHQYCFYDDNMLHLHHEFMAISHALSPKEIEHALRIEYQTLCTVQADEGHFIVLHFGLPAEQVAHVNEVTICERAWKSGKQQLLLEVLLQHWHNVQHEYPDAVCLIPVLMTCVQDNHFSLHLMQVCQRLGVPLNQVGLKLLPHRMNELNIEQVQQGIEQLHYLNVKITCDFFSTICSDYGLYRYFDAVVLEKNLPFFNLIDDVEALKLVLKPILELCFAVNVGILLDQKLNSVYFKLNLAEEASMAE